MEKGKGFDYRNVLLLFVVLVLCFGALEWAVRGLALTDRLGFQRVPPVAERVAALPPKQSGEFRLLGLGDSFTIFRDASGGNFLRYAASFAERDGRAVTVANLAESGTGIQSYFANLSAHADAVKPDAVVIGLYLGNDVGPENGPYLSDLRAGEQPAPKAEAGRAIGLSELAKRSVLINLVYRLAKTAIPALQTGALDRNIGEMRRREGRDAAFVEAGLARADPKLVELARSDAINGWDLVYSVFFPRYYVDLYTLPAGSRSAMAIDGMKRDLRYLVDWCRKRNLPVLAVLMHPGIVVDAKYHEYYRRLGYELPPADMAPPPLVARLSAFLDAEGVANIDTLAPLRAAGGDLYIPNDTHLNSDGQRVVGEAFFELLKRRFPGRFD